MGRSLCSRRFLGMGTELASVLVYSAGLLLLKTLDTNLPVDYFSFVVSLTQLTIVIPWLITGTKKEDYTVKLYGEWKVHVARGFVGASCFFVGFSAIQKIPLSDFIAINKTTPCFVTVFAYFLLKEKFRWTHVLTLVFTICGVVLVCRPSFLFGSTAAGGNVGGRLVGILYALVTAVLNSLIYICLRKMHITPIRVSMASSAAISVSFFLVVMAVQSSWDLIICSQSAIIFCVSLGYALGTGLRFAASRLEDAGRLSVVGVMDLPITFVGEMMFFGYLPYWTGYVGVVLILASLLSLFLLKNREERRRTQNAEAPREHDTKETSV